MALTVTQVTHPNQIITEFQLGPFKARMVDVAFDNSYPTTGEVLTAASQGWDQLHGAVVVGHPTNAAGTSMIPVYVESNAARTQVTLQLFRYDGASAGKASLEEAANAFDASLFSCRLLLFGS